MGTAVPHVRRYIYIADLTRYLYYIDYCYIILWLLEILYSRRGGYRLFCGYSVTSKNWSPPRHHNPTTNTPTHQPAPLFDLAGPKCNWYVVAVTCPWPGDPPHGYAAVSQNSYRPGEHVSISCEPYYVLDGQPKLVCGDNGEWSAPMPICKWGG